MGDYDGFEVFFHISLAILASGMALIIGFIAAVRLNIDLTAGRIALLIGMALLMALPPIFFRRMLYSAFENFFFPGEYYDRPLPVFSKADALRTQERIPEAIVAYEELIQQAPDLSYCYCQLMDIYDQEYHQPEAVEEVYQRGVSAIRDPKEMRQLQDTYQEIVKGWS